LQHVIAKWLFLMAVLTRNLIPFCGPAAKAGGISSNGLAGMNPNQRRSFSIRLPILLFTSCALAAGENSTPTAARSVHLWYPAPDGKVFYNELTVEKSAPGSYFMACGFNHGYFGMQELTGKGEKVVLFSVWDSGTQDDPSSVAREKRVEVLHEAPDVRVQRFGGEGTGAQCFYKYVWEIDESCRFLVHASTNGNKTAYSAWFYLNDQNTWKHLATFRTITGGEPLKGYYSFVEDFRRDGKSPHEVRRARFGPGWVRTMTGDWLELTRARFTADSTPLDSINATAHGNAFVLETGGSVVQTLELKSSISRPVVAEKPAALQKALELPLLRANDPSTK
jgi:hypothetical protein